MEELKGIEYFIQQGGGYALAGFMFYFWRKDNIRKLDDLRDEKKILIDLVSETKSVMQELISTIRARDAIR